MERIDTIADVARRIERAYLLQVGGDRQFEDGTRVWIQAAHALVYLNQLDPSMPVDPELFVISRPPSRRTGDPARDLAGMNALLYYQRKVRGIVRQLRREIHDELRWIDRRLARGQALDAILIQPTQRISPLARFLAAQRNNRPDLALAFRDSALLQGDACPLYREAVRQFLPRTVAETDDSRQTLIEQTSPAPSRVCERN